MKERAMDQDEQDGDGIAQYYLSVTDDRGHDGSESVPDQWFFSEEEARVELAELLEEGGYAGWNFELIEYPDSGKDLRSDMPRSRGWVIWERTLDGCDPM
jgi:hypothetical protein